MVSRATVYNTLKLFAAKGLLRQLALAEGRLVFDSNVAKHHHFIDDETGRICDVPWDALNVTHTEDLEGFNVRDYQVLLRGTTRSKKSKARSG